MKKITIMILLVLALFIFSGCAQDNSKLTDVESSAMQDDFASEGSISNDLDEETKTTDNEVLDKAKTGVEASTKNIVTPVAKFTAEDISKLSIDCKGSNEEIAECIFDWQQENMIYVPNAVDNEGPFLESYELRWQELVPGIYTAKDLLENHISNSGKLYGVCFGFSVIYCSIAEYYGLDCRISQSYININNEERPGGMSISEYEEFLPWLTKAGLKYDYEAVRLAMPDDSEVAGHYWAEVKLDSPSDFDNGEWRIVDASNKQSNGRQMTFNHIKEGKSWEVVDWSKKDRTNILDELQARIDAGEDIGRQNEEGKSDMDTFSEGRDIYADDVEAGREEVYVGITDELENKNRAATIDDFMQGKALAPYMMGCRDSCDFIMAGDDCKDDCEDLDEVPARCYDSCAGEEFFIVCDYICEDSSDSEWPTCYKACSGNDLNLKCDNSCWDD